jgi:hypothetical protein
VKQLTVLNACFFLYCLLAANAEVYHHQYQISQLKEEHNCSESLTCAKFNHSYTRPKAKLKISEIFLGSVGYKDLTDFNISLVDVNPFKNKFIYLPIYRFIKTGLSPPVIS